MCVCVNLRYVYRAAVWDDGSLHHTCGCLRRHSCPGGYFSSDDGLLLQTSDTKQHCHLLNKWPQRTTLPSTECTTLCSLSCKKSRKVTAATSGPISKAALVYSVYNNRS